MKRLGYITINNDIVKQHKTADDAFEYGGTVFEIDLDSKIIYRIERFELKKDDNDTKNK